MTKVWYEIYGDAQYEKNILLGKIKSKGLAYIVAQTMKLHYQNIVVK